MSDRLAREQLLNLLDKKAFDPVLQAPPNDYKSESDRQKLRDLQDRYGIKKVLYWFVIIVFTISKLKINELQN